MTVSSSTPIQPMMAVILGGWGGRLQFKKSVYHTKYCHQMPNLHSTLKSRDITVPTKDRIVKAMIFPVVMYRCESWTIKKAERQRIDVFELWHSKRLLKVPWTARRSNQSILKEINPKYSLERLMATRLEEVTH